LVVGRGGREHAIVWSLARSARVDEILCAPGNPGIAELAESVPVPVGDLDCIVRLAVDRQVDLVVVGPEDPLAAGLGDILDAAGIPVFGHTAAAARIESSKSWSKDVMVSAGIPTARSIVAADLESGRNAIAEIGGGGPVMVKVDGLAAGKGVVVADDRAGAEAALISFMTDEAFGEAGATVVIEERLSGPEVSIMLLTDGAEVRILAPSCDHKRAFDGDLGPNTGGMGVYTPTAKVNEAMMTLIEQTIVLPAVREMARRGTPLRGVLYPGLMLTDDGPKVIEFNCRFGDPETQVVLPTTHGDLGEWAMAAAHGTLSQTPLPASSGSSVGVVLASRGYPGPFDVGFPIHGLEAAAGDPDVIVFHSGTARSDRGEILTAGGRVLTVVGLGPDLASARVKAYEAAGQISFEGSWMRRDIASATLRGEPV
jgi:phosphoribosylamine--glycine ligase